ncbi:bolA-like protein 3 isoform X1 [Callithrix jacchus]
MAAWSPAAAAPLLRGIRGLPLHCVHRMFASQTEGELRVTQILKEKFPQATAIKVTDISGGCGAMYEIKIESEEFKEKRTVQQHQMVNQLQERIMQYHNHETRPEKNRIWEHLHCGKKEFNSELKTSLPIVVLYILV